MTVCLHRVAWQVRPLVARTYPRAVVIAFDDGHHVKTRLPPPRPLDPPAWEVRRPPAGMCPVCDGYPGPWTDGPWPRRT